MSRYACSVDGYGGGGIADVRMTPRWGCDRAARPGKVGFSDMRWGKLDVTTKKSSRPAQLSGVYDARLYVLTSDLYLRLYDKIY